jgi:hypothetical protein
MILVNYTTMPDQILRRIIRFVRPPGVTGFKIKFTNCSYGYRGVAYYTDCARSAPTAPGPGNRVQPKPYVLIGVYRRTQKVKWRCPYSWMGTDVPLHENLGEDYRDNRGEVDRVYLDKQGTAGAEIIVKPKLPREVRAVLAGV